MSINSFAYFFYIFANCCYESIFQSRDEFIVWQVLCEQDRLKISIFSVFGFLSAGIDYWLGGKTGGGDNTLKGILFPGLIQDFADGAAKEK